MNNVRIEIANGNPLTAFAVVPVRTEHQDEQVRVKIASLRPIHEEPGMAALHHEFDGDLALLGKRDGITSLIETLRAAYKMHPKALGLSTYREYVPMARAFARKLGLRKGRFEEGICVFRDDILTIEARLTNGKTIVTRGGKHIFEADENGVVTADDNGAHFKIATPHIDFLFNTSWMKEPR